MGVQNTRSFVCISYLVFIPIGIDLTYRSPKRAVRAIGHCLYVAGFVGLAFSGWKILAIALPIPTVRLGPFQLIEWEIAGGLIGLVYSYLIGRALAEQLRDQADLVKDFS